MVVGVEVDRLTEHVDFEIAGACVAGVVDVAVDRVHRHVVGGPHRVDLEVAAGLGDEDARGRAGEDVEHVEHAGTVEHVDIDLEVVECIADAADRAGESGEHRDVAAAHVGAGRGCRPGEGSDQIGGGLGVVLSVEDPAERPDRDVAVAGRNVVDPEVADPLLDVDELVGEQDHRAGAVVVGVGVDDAGVADWPAGEVTHRHEVAGRQVGDATGRAITIVDRAADRHVDVVLGARGEQVAAVHGYVAGSEVAELVERARTDTVVGGERTVGAEEALGVVLGCRDLGPVDSAMDVDRPRPTGCRAIDAVEHEDVDVVAGRDRPERDHELVGDGAGGDGVAVRGGGQHDVVAGVRLDDDQAGQDRLPDGVRTVRGAPQRVADRRRSVVGVVALDQLDVERRAAGGAGVGTDRAESVEVQLVGADHLLSGDRGVGVATRVGLVGALLDVAVGGGDMRLADRVVDHAVEEHVPIGSRRLIGGDRDNGLDVGVDDLEVEAAAFVDVQDPEVGRRRATAGDARDVDLDLVGTRRLDHIDIHDVDVVLRLVDDRDEVPGLLEVEDRRVAPDLTVGAFVLAAVADVQFVGEEEHVR